MSAPDRFSRLLAELVRLLHERGHVFATDPAVLDRALAQSAEPPEMRMVQRARMLDRDGALAAALARTERRARLLRTVLTALAAAGGFMTAAALMQQSGLNFFLVLAGVLGMNTLMLLLWLAAAHGLRRRPGAFLPADWWVGGGSRFQEALLALYGEEWRQPPAPWQAGALSHRLWAASLGGMAAALLLLLSVRQYTFNWESTLLSDHSLVQWVAALAWLPERLGFPVPDAQAVLASRLQHHTAGARQWGGLLLGSLLCYGLLPRLLAWGYCVWRARCRPAALPLDLPYYRQILRGWQRRVVDAGDDYQADVPPLPPLPADRQAEAWAVMLERPWPDAAWHRHVLGRVWQDGGVADSRDRVAALLDDLARQPVQLLIGIRTASLPDRGLLRQVDRLAQAAQGGTVVQLLAVESEYDGLPGAVAQWQAALQARGLPVLPPPHMSQQGFR